MALQLFDKSEKFVPFRAIERSTEGWIFGFAVHLVAVQDTSDLYNMVIQCELAIRTYCSRSKGQRPIRDTVPEFLLKISELIVTAV